MLDPVVTQASRTFPLLFPLQHFFPHSGFEDSVGHQKEKNLGAHGTGGLNTICILIPLANLHLSYAMLEVELH